MLLDVNALEENHLDLGRSLGRQRQTMRKRVDRVHLLGALEECEADGALL